MAHMASGARPMNTSSRETWPHEIQAALGLPGGSELVQLYMVQLGAIGAKIWKKNDLGKRHMQQLPSGKLTENYGKSPLLMGKSW